MADTVGYLFLGQVIVMALLVVWLFVEMQRDDAKTRRDRRRGYTIHKERMPKELCVYAIITSLFALSYIGRFILEEHFGCDSDYTGSSFVAYIVQYACYLFEGAIMGAIMCSHMAFYQTKSEREDRSSTIEEEENGSFTRCKTYARRT